MEIKLDTPQLQELFSQAVLASLDDVKRDVILKSAIEHLVSKPTSGYCKQQSPIEEAFSTAMRQVATTIARDMLTSDPTVTTKLRELIAEALVQLTETNREATVSNLARVIAEGLAKRD